MSETELIKLFFNKAQLIDESQLAIIGSLCRRLSTKVEQELSGLIKEEVLKVCKYAVQNSLGPIVTDLDILDTSDRYFTYLKPSLSSISGYREAFSLFLALCCARKLGKALARRRPKEVEQTKVLQTKLSWSPTRSLQIG